MIGIFDSGVGGLTAYKEVRRLSPSADIIYLADRKNAPYGTKKQDELIRLVKNDVKLLRSLGATDILIACCTASTVYPFLDARTRRRTIPIITPSVKASLGLKRIAVIATEHTVKCHAFGNAIRKMNPQSSVLEISAQPLVSMVECGSRDGNISGLCREYLEKTASRIREFNADGLILGCTHFSHLENTLGEYLPEVKIISPAREGARKLVERSKALSGYGKNIYV